MIDENDFGHDRFGLRIRLKIWHLLRSFVMVLCAFVVQGFRTGAVSDRACAKKAHL